MIQNLLKRKKRMSTLKTIAMGFLLHFLYTVDRYSFTNNSKYFQDSFTNNYRSNFINKHVLVIFLHTLYDNHTRTY